MSKLEMVRDLNSTGPQLQIVQSVQELRQTVSEMRSLMASLPDAVATETAQALEPLTQLQQDVERVLRAYDTVTAHQRKALDELSAEMLNRASEEFRKKADSMESRMDNITKPLKTGIMQVNLAATKAEESVIELDKARKSMLEVSEKLESLIPQQWKTVALAAMTGLIVGLVMLLGTAALNKPAPSEEAQMMRELWAKASPQERQLLKSILDRPGK